MHRNQYYKVTIPFILFLLIFGFISCNAPADPPRPNVLFILADDMGVEVLGSYGGKSYKTPNLDKLAKEGTRFLNGHSAPACSPTRVKLLTGRYGFRTTQTWGHIPENEITFGHVLTKAGYKVAIAGKWQMALLRDDPDHIRKMGFPESCVFGWHEGPRYYNPLIYQNGKIRKDVSERYGPEIYSDFLIDFMKRHRDTPFLAFYSMALAHDVSDDFSPPPPFGPNGRYDTYGEQVVYLDKMVGKMVQALDDLGLRDNTLILFTADNGTPARFITGRKNGDFIREEIYSQFGDTLIQGGKASTTDGGTHVPLIANWPGKVAAGAVDESLIDFTDFMPTFAELSGAELPRDVMIDGFSFAPQILGEPGSPRQWLYTLFKDDEWIRDREWKLYGDGRLYYLERDPFERHPVEKTSASVSARETRKKFEKILESLKR